MIACIAGALACVALYRLNESGFDWSFSHAPQIGHVTRAYGTVKLEGHGRLESGRSILVPLRLGDQLQTGEDSAAEALFFGGSILQLQPGAVARFEDSGDDVAIRLLMGRAYLEFPPEMTGAMAGAKFVFRDANGKLVSLPRGRRLVMTLGSVNRLEDSVEVRALKPEEKFESLGDAELKYLALGDREVSNMHPLIVEPIDEQGRKPVTDRKLDHLAPLPAHPVNDGYADVDRDKDVAFAWNPVRGPASDPVIGYEIELRPAFNYEVEDRARRMQIFKDRSTALRMDQVGGGGVFLWSVRAVTSSGDRGPSSAPRWIEIKFPKQLAAPELLAPKVE